MDTQNHADTAPDAADFEQTLELEPSELTDSEKIDEIRQSVRQLNDEIRKLSAFLTAPAKKPSAIDQLVAAIEALTRETQEQGKTLGSIAGVLESIASMPESDTAGGGDAVGPAPSYSPTKP